MTLRPTVTSSKENTLYLYILEGQHTADLFAVEAVNSDDKGVRRQLHAPDMLLTCCQLRALRALEMLAPAPAPPSTPSNKSGMFYRHAWEVSTFGEAACPGQPYYSY